MPEYYIKQPDTDHARGPFSFEQLLSLAETGNVTEDTLFYDETAEKWKPIGANPELVRLLFPTEKKLKLNRMEAAPTEDEVASEIAEGKAAPKVSTETILAAASGDTKDTRHIGRRKRSKEKAASQSVPGIGALLAVSALALIYPAKNLVINAISSDEAFFSVLINPMVLIGLVMIAFAVGIFLGVTSLFNFARYLAAVCTGLMGYLYWAWQSPILAVCALMMGGGLFIATISTRYAPLMISLMIGFIGAITLAYFAITGVIIYP